MSITTYTIAVKDMKSACAALILQIQNGEEFDDLDIRIESEGTIESISKACASMLSNYNNWIV
jgi:hypothetical protein